MAISRDGRSLYVAAAGADALQLFRRGRKTGRLRPGPCIEDAQRRPRGCASDAPGLDDASAVAISPDGRSTYVTSSFDSAVVSFRRDRRTGRLRARGCIDDPDEGEGRGP